MCKAILISQIVRVTQKEKSFNIPFSDLPGTKGGREGRGWGRGARRRNDPNNVCTCE
jgi:hypothetical protein